MFAERGRTSVSGPGQNDSANFEAIDGQRITQRSAISWLATWTIIGLWAGRPLISKIRETAVASSAFAAKP
jgi:hypothetical protein